MKWKNLPEEVRDLRQEEVDAMMANLEEEEETEAVEEREAEEKEAEEKEEEVAREAEVVKEVCLIGGCVF